MEPGHRDGRTQAHPKQRWLSWADDLVSAAWAHASPTGALLQLPGPESASGVWNDGLEGFARTFLAAAFRIRGTDGRDPRRFLERYARGLSVGVDPDAEERWPTFIERRGAIVEAASIAIALSETRPWLWDRLGPREQQLAVDWFSGILGRTDFTNNWLWFQNVIEAFLRSVGADDRPADLDRNADLAEDLYVGDGWYSDGRNREGRRQNFDWYSGWAWHVYPLLEARIRGAELAEVHRDRLHRYLQQARALIGPDGAPVLIGRSVTYRFAVLAPFWAGVLADATPLPAGHTRVLGERTVAHFLAHGALTEDGLLPVGWHGPFARVRQDYTGASSPYWASKGLLGLLLPSGHPEWRTPDPAPATGPVAPTTPAATAPAPQVTPMAAPGWLVVSSPADSLVRVLNHGSDRVLQTRSTPRADDPFYGRAGYSNVTSPQLDADAVAAPVESHTTLLDAQRRPAHRDCLERLHLDEQLAMSRSVVHWLDPDGTGTAPGSPTLRQGPVLTVASIVDGVTELRLAWWRQPTTGDLDEPTEQGPWRIRFGGWAVSGPSAPQLDVVPPADHLHAPPAPSAPAARAQVVRHPDGLTSVVHGLGTATVAEIVTRQGADPMALWSATPTVATSRPHGTGEVAAALVLLTAAAAPVQTPQLTTTEDGIVVDWPSGRTCLVPTDGPVTW